MSQEDFAAIDQVDSDLWEVDFPCACCSDKIRCQARGENGDSWIYSEQFALCVDLCEPCYEDDDYFIIAACTEDMTIDETIVLLSEEMDDEDDL